MLQPVEEPLDPVAEPVRGTVEGPATTFFALRFRLGWRPVEVHRLYLGDIRRAVAKSDGYILREQKHRRGKMDRSTAPMLPEVLEKLRQLEETLADLPDDVPVFYDTRGHRKGKPLGGDGVRGVIKELLEEGVRAEIPDAIPYDLRGSFAALIGRSVIASGGRPSEVQDRVRRLLGNVNRDAS